EAEGAASSLLGMQLVTPQTSSQGVKVRRVLVEEAVQVVQELYLGMVIDRAAAKPVVMASESGGMEIEELAARDPEKIRKVHVDPGTGLLAFQARRMAFELKLPAGLISPWVHLLGCFYRAFVDHDASLAEINPLGVLGKGGLLALDAKMDLDDNALFRQREIQGLRDEEEEDPLEVEASRYHINYIKLDGNIGCMVNGAGLAMATMDMIKLCGGEPANFLDVGGGASAEQVENAFRILISDPAVKAILINIFGGILRCDVLAQGVIEAASKLKAKVPMVVRLEGTHVEEGRALLNRSGLRFTVAADMQDAAEKAIALSRQF
ncbi:MAG: ADP-forming succinate--CoA ligase subunit beta, partial [candidate division NC10 bacterium]|nr:ADP-forming succinate--CoA ligase subunit beta [candidate division NC10 bacterium]